MPSNKKLLMSTIRQYIKHNKEFIRERDNQTARPRFSQAASVPQPPPTRTRVPSLQAKKLSLPPIHEFSPRAPLFSLQLKRSMDLNRYFQAKSQAIVSKQSLRTEGQDSRSVIPRSNFAVNLEEFRMRPLDKYFYRLQNIRLAERLLVVKPSPQVRRGSQKRFFMKQKHYSSRLSRNPTVVKKSRANRHKTNPSIASKQWVN